LCFAQNNTGVLAIDTLKRYDWDIETKNNNLSMVHFASFFFPGGGQFYTGHYVRGGFLFTFEVALIYETFYNKFRQNRIFNKNIRTYGDSVSFYSDLIALHSDSSDTSVWKESEIMHTRILSKERSKKRASRDLWMSEFAWLAGLHIYGVFDAYGIWKNNQGHDTQTHSATSALWRAALIPGWGQIYNHEYGKAGLLYMGLVGSAISYYSRQKMVEYHLVNLRQAKQAEDDVAISIAEEDILFFRKKRNQYVWSITLFYLYSLADAAVDAMLHSFDSPAYFVMQPTLNRGMNVEAGFYF
jgi:TM2 domain-containing membrane protein YozV